MALLCLRNGFIRSTTWFPSVQYLLRRARPSDALGGDVRIARDRRKHQPSEFHHPEFFARCKCKYPLGIFAEGDPRADLGIDTSPYNGRAFNLDEACELRGHLDLVGKARGEKDGAPSVRASTLNTLISSGKTRRATRTSTNFGESRGTPASISIVGNGRPEKFIPMDRGMLGSHTAATKQRFLICLDHSIARHAA
jgi:hypothetical protein